MTQLSDHNFNLESDSTLYSNSNFIFCVQCIGFITTISFVIRNIYLSRNLIQVITWVQSNELIYIIFIIEGLLEEIIKSFIVWNFNPRPLILSRQQIQLNYQVMSSTFQHRKLCMFLQFHLFIKCWSSIWTITVVTLHFCLSRSLEQVITWK